MKMLGFLIVVIMFFIIIYDLKTDSKSYYTNFHLIGDDEYNYSRTGKYFVEFDDKGIYITDTSDLSLQFNKLENGLYQEEGYPELFELIQDDYVLVLHQVDNKNTRYEDQEYHFSGLKRN